MPKFDLYFPILLKWEGGFRDYKEDPGGATNKGITIGTFQLYAKEVLGIEPTLENLKALTDDQAYKIYKIKFWDAIRASEYPSQELANMVADFYVNAGANGTKVLQRVLNSLGNNLTVDGAIGAMSLKAIQGADQRKLYSLFRQARIDYYHAITKSNPEFKIFIQGWLNRVNDFPVELP